LKPAHFQRACERFAESHDPATDNPADRDRPPATIVSLQEVPTIVDFMQFAPP
jgi:hypothetical protein